MHPILKLANDKKEYSILETVSKLSAKFRLSKQESERRLPGGSKKIFYDRVHWALLYLRHAGLVKSTRRGHFQITSRGVNVLTTTNQTIDKEYLKRFPEFSDYVNWNTWYLNFKNKKKQEA